MKLKLQLEYFEKAITVQILEMDERFRCIDGENNFTASNGFIISSAGNPALCTNEMALRGKSRVYDFEVELRKFHSNTDRDEYVIRMMDALSEWAEKWEGFKDDTPEEKSDSSIYIF